MDAMDGDAVEPSRSMVACMQDRVDLCANSKHISRLRKLLIPVSQVVFLLSWRAQPRGERHGDCTLQSGTGRDDRLVRRQNPRMFRSGTLMHSHAATQPRRETLRQRGVAEQTCIRSHDAIIFATKPQPRSPFPCARCHATHQHCHRRQVRGA